MSRFLQSVGLALLLALLISLDPSIAQAQTPNEVTGAADFRNPPILTPGIYADEIVSGETVWYGVIYNDGTPFRIAASLLGEGSNSAELELVTSMVSPTLAQAASAEGILESSGVSTRGADTDLWYITVELQTTGVIGTAHRVMLEIEGVEFTSPIACSRIPGCTYDDDLAALDAQVDELQPQLDDALALPNAEFAQREIDSLESFVSSAERQRTAEESRLAAAEARLAELCSPQASCTSFPDPGGKAPIWALLPAIGVLGWGIYRIVKQVRSTKGKKPKPTKTAGYTPQGIRPTAT